MVISAKQDRSMLEEMPRDQLLDLFALHIRNIWRVDGLYFLGIEEKFGTKSAIEIDANCWRVMGKIEARYLKKIMGVDHVTPDSLIHLLRNTSWALDIAEKRYEISEKEARMTVVSCGTQETRIRKGLGVFPCKQVRAGYLESFTKELDPEIEMMCRICPPDERPPDVWCKWEFKFKEAA